MNSNQRKIIETAIKGLQQLPTLPVVYNRLQTVLNNQRVSAQQVGMVIEQDQSLATKILKIVNSAYYSFPRRISTVSQAVVILGFNEIKHLALSISIIQAFGNKNGNEEFDYMDFWRHSIGVAICSGILAKKASAVKCGSNEEAFVAGLLHDIGKVLEEQYFHKAFLDSIRKCKAEQLLLYEAEKEILGFSHEESGEYLLESWKLPGTLVNVTGFHHSPAAKKNNMPLFTTISIVHIADIITRALGLGNGGDPFVPSLNKECWEVTGLNIDSLETISVEVLRSFEEMAKFLLM